MEWRLFPPSKPSFYEGDEVFICPKSKNERGKVGRVVRLQHSTSHDSGDDITRSSSSGTSKGGVSTCSKNNHSGEKQGSSAQCEGEGEGGGIKNASQRVAIDLISTFNSRDRNIVKKRQSSPSSNVLIDTAGTVGVHSRHETAEEQEKNVKEEALDCNDRRQRTFRRVRLIRRYHNTFKQNRAQQEPPQPPPSKKNQCHIFITAKTNHFRNLATSQLHPSTTDQVLEIGCSNGECSTAIAPYCKKFIGFDTSVQMIEEAKEKMKLRMQKKNRFECCCEYMFHVIDPFIDPNQAKMIAHGVNVVLIDIGGNREIDSVILMIDWVQESLPDVMLIIVKSEEMFECIEALTQRNRRHKSIIKNDDDDYNKISIQSIQGKNIKASMNNEINFPANAHADIVKVHENDGLILNGDKWYNQSLITAKQNSLRKARTIGPPKYLHPLRAPMSLSPKDNETPICRYHNYHPQGCKYKDECKFDHWHCHWCLQKGHMALNCTFVGLLKVNHSIQSCKN